MNSSKAPTQPLRQPLHSNSYFLPSEDQSPKNLFHPLNFRHRRLVNPPFVAQPLRNQPQELEEFPLPHSLRSLPLQPLLQLLNRSLLVPRNVAFPLSTRILRSSRNADAILLQHNVLVRGNKRRKQRIVLVSLVSKMNVIVYGYYFRIGKIVLVSLERLRWKMVRH